MCKLVRVKTNHNTYVKVAEHKRDCIAGIIRAAKNCDLIEEIIVFGSAVESRCKRTSDIDLAIVSNVTRSKLFHNKSYDRFVQSVYELDRTQSYDILQFNSREKLEQDKAFVCKDIREKGRVIYQRMGQQYGSGINKKGVIMANQYTPENAIERIREKIQIGQSFSLPDLYGDDWTTDQKTAAELGRGFRTYVIDGKVHGIRIKKDNNAKNHGVYERFL